MAQELPLRNSTRYISTIRFCTFTTVYSLL